MMTTTGVNMFFVNETSPAYDAGLRNNTIITEVNGQPLEVSYCEYDGGGMNNFIPFACKGGSGYFAEELGYIIIGQEIEMRSENGDIYNVTVGSIEVEEMEIPFIGILYKPMINQNMPFFMFSVLNMLSLLWIFSFAVAIVNILPIYPLDGGLMMEAVVEKLSKKKSKKIVKIISWAVFLIILYNFIGPVLL